jgi:hypothetical protein
MNQRADREKLFAALEMFVNCGDTASDLHRFRLQHQTFFPEAFYEQSEQLANAGKKDNFFSWLKRQLRAVWAGQDPHGKRLSVLLGLESVSYAGPPNGDFAVEATEHMAIFTDFVVMCSTPSDDHASVGGFALSAARIVPDWLGGGFRYEPWIEFQDAVHMLMSESWRAKVCRMCRRYIVAAKPGSMYCSTKCAGLSKQKRDRMYWGGDGKVLRQKRNKSRKK